MHFAIQVSNVEEAASRVVAAGGTTMFPVAPYGSKGSVSYCVDPDGNVMDVLDLDWAQTVAATLENFTDATPSSSR
jgi:predicted enzyme related to lactoylglutathione lyase